MQDKHGLLTVPIAQVLRNMTIPMVFGMVAILMFNLIDTFFVSLLGTDALAAISFTFPVTFGVNSITMGIGVGLSTNIARLLGQKKNQYAANFTSHGLLLAALLVSISSLCGLFYIDPLFRLLGAETHLIPLIQDYMLIWYVTVPLLVIPMVGNSAIRATGDTKTPAKIMIVAGAINGVLDPLLIFGYGPFPEMGIQGAAIASGISWLGALFYSLFVLISRERLLSFPQFSYILDDWKQILKIGTPAAISIAMSPICGAVLMTLLASHGTAAVAAYGATQRIESFLLIIVMSLSSALTPFIAQNIGARNYIRSFRALFMSMRFVILFQLLVFVMMVPLSISLASLFSQEESVKHLIWLYLVIVPISYGFQGVIMLLVGSLNAMHRPFQAFGWSFMRLFLFSLPGAWIGNNLYGIEGLFIGIAVGNVTGGVLGYLYAIKLKKSTF